MIKVTSYSDKLDLADELADEFVPEALEAAGEAGDLFLHAVQRRLSLRKGTAKTVAPEGQPPEEDSGDLLRSFKRISPRVKGRTASSGVQSTHPGVSRLERGFTDARGVRTLPHPFLAPAEEAIEDGVTNIVERHFR